MNERIDFDIDSNHPYLTQVVGLSDELIKHFKKYPGTYPMDMMDNNKIKILTSDILVFIKRLRDIDYSNIYESRKEYKKMRKYRVMIKNIKSQVKCYIKSKFNEIYFNLLMKKYNITYCDSEECFTLSRRYFSKMKQNESDYIKFMDENEEDGEEEEMDEDEEKEMEIDKDDEEIYDKEEEKEEEKEKEEEQEKEQGWISYIANVFGFGTPHIKDDLSKYFGDKSGHAKYTGKYAWQWGWLLYLQKQLGDDVVCVWKGDTGEGGIFFNKYKNHHLEIKDWVIDELNRCIKDVESPFTIGVMTIKTHDSTNHANALIFDRRTKRLIRFEPHGGETNSYDHVLLDMELSRWLKKNFGKEWLEKIV